MRIPTIIAFALSATLASAQTVPELNAEAQRAYLSGDLVLAKARFERVLEMDPSNQTAANYLRMIRTQESKERGNKLAKQLESLVIPSVDIKEASFSSALEYLKQRAAAQNQSVSFVSQMPNTEANEKTVTLAIRDAPFTEILRYICQQAHAEFEIEKYAVVIRPKAK